MQKFGVSESKTEGYSWDERGNTDISQILISYNASSIVTLQFVYAGKKGLRHSKVHGLPSATALNYKAVIFDYPSEFLTSVSGKYTNKYGCYNLCSITFGTNKGKYGPFGMTKENSTPTYNFNYDFECLGSSAFGGFHGYEYDLGVSSIGVYINPLDA